VKPNLVVLLAGRWEVVDRLYEGRRTNILHPAFAAYLKQALVLANSSSTPPATLAQGYSVLANALRQSGDLDGALQAITEARAWVAKTTYENEARRVLGLYAVYNRQGLILGEDESVSLGRTEEAIGPFTEAFELVDGGAAKDPADAGLHDRAATAGVQLGDVLRHRDPARALAVYDRAIARIREARALNTSRTLHEAKLLAHSSYPLRSLHRIPEARQRIEEAFQLLRTIDIYPEYVGIIGGEWDNAMRARADLEAEAGDLRRARATMLELYEALLEKKPSPETDLRHAYDMSRTYATLARLASGLNMREEAAKFDALRLDLWRGWDKRLPDNWYIHQRLAEPTTALK